MYCRSTCTTSYIAALVRLFSSALPLANVNNNLGRDNGKRYVVGLITAFRQEFQSPHHPNNGARQTQLGLPPILQLPIDPSKPALRR